MYAFVRNKWIQLECFCLIMQEIVKLFSVSRVSNVYAVATENRHSQGEFDKVTNNVHSVIIEMFSV